jgi:hypothetical protein
MTIFSGAGGEKDPSHYCDSFEYPVWRIVSSDNEFRDLYELTRTFRNT